MPKSAGTEPDPPHRRCGCSDARWNHVPFVLMMVIAFRCSLSDLAKVKYSFFNTYFRVKSVKNTSKH